MINYQPSRDEIISLICAYSPGFDASAECLQHGCIVGSSYGEHWEWNRKSFDSMSDDEVLSFYERLKAGKLVDPDFQKKLDAQRYTNVSLPVLRRQFPKFKK